MKGLFIKDIKLISGQKRLIVINLAIALALGIFNSTPSFLLVYMPFIIITVVSSTISYDEYDNGNEFLFTLPISRAEYAAEKYCFSLLCGGGAWLLGVVVALIICAVKETAEFSDTVMTAVAILPVLILMLSIMLPIKLKFSAEKGTTVLFISFAALFLVGVCALKITEYFGIDMSEILTNLTGISAGISFAAAVIISVIILAVSVKISKTIMNRKEF